MRVHIFQHGADEGPAAIEPWLRNARASVTYTRFYAGESLPAIQGIDGLIILGGAMSVNDEAELPWLKPEKAFIAEAIARGIPVLGICLGAQMIANALGATVTRNPEREIGWFPVSRVASANENPLGRCFSEVNELFQWHGETFALPPGTVHLLRSEACENQAFALGRHVLALQFHLETTIDTANDFIATGREDLMPGKFVQSESEIIGSLERFARSQRLLDRVLTTLLLPRVDF